MYKIVNKKNGKLSDKIEEETLWNKPWKKREPLFLKSITTIEPVTVWFEITKYSNKKAMTIVNLVDTTWLVQYPWPVEIRYDQVGEFLARDH